MRLPDLLELTSKRDRARIRAIERAQRQDAVAIDGLDAYRQPTCCSRDHAGEEEAGLLVGDDDARVRRERCKQTTTGTRFRLDVWPVGDARGRKRVRVVGHALQDERVNTIACP